MAGLADDISNGEIMIIVVGVAAIGYMLYRATNAVSNVFRGVASAAGNVDKAIQQSGVQYGQQVDCVYAATNIGACCGVCNPAPFGATSD